MADILNGEYANGAPEPETAHPADNIKDEYDEDMEAFIAQVAGLAPAEVNIDVEPSTINVADFDPDYNLLDPEIRARYNQEGSLMDENDIFTGSISTTDTLEGYLSNVKTHEEQLIQELEPDCHFVMFKCNYGVVKYSGYTEPVKQKKSNRGRKKKEKKKKIRKRQGNGGSFNSQVSFIVLSSEVPDPEIHNNGIVPYGAKVFKFKVFRNGMIQLPGVKPNSVNDVIECARRIAEKVNWHLHMFDDNPANQTRVININPVMRNYKFTLKIPVGKIIDLRKLQIILQNELRGKNLTTGPDGEIFKSRPMHPPIFSVKYDRQDTKISIKFSTGIYKKPKKKTRINIFMRGKINILGAFASHVTRQICDYLYWIFKSFPDIIVQEGVKIIPQTTQPNIACVDEELEEIANSFLNYIPASVYTVPITDDDLRRILEMISTNYSDCRSDANIEAEKILSDLGAVL
jgi:hypothetical protein